MSITPTPDARSPRQGKPRCTALALTPTETENAASATNGTTALVTARMAARGRSAKVARTAATNCRVSAIEMTVRVATLAYIIMGSSFFAALMALSLR